jgi:cyclopropane fatty-acyl-phospholipid synthase-like methyltransferase
VGISALARRSVEIALDEGLHGLVARTTTYAKMRLLSLFGRTEPTRALYYRLFDSTQYWEQRYADGRDSGPGSRGGHRQFKADFLNAFVDEHDIESVLEFGCGDGDQVALADYPEYRGLEISESAVEACAERFADDETKTFAHYDPNAYHDEQRTRFEAELVLSLEVVFHLVDDETFEKTMHDMFESATRYVIVFSSNHDESTPELHVRHRRFTDYVETEFPAFELVETVENEYESRHSDFYIYEKR